MFLAAASQRTKNIRLGHGIVQIPPGFNHPGARRRADRDARPDLRRPRRVRHRRVELAGRAGRRSASIARPSARSGRSALDAITRMFVEEPFAGLRRPVASRCRRAASLPKPKQKPHPPLWVACSRRETILLAARKGIGALTFAFIEPEQAQGVGRRVLRADRTPTSACPAGFAVNPNFAVVLPMMLHEDEADGDRARHRRRALLRLLARPLLRVRRPPARASRTSGTSSRPSAPTTGSRARSSTPTTGRWA